MNDRPNDLIKIRPILNLKKSITQNSIRKVDNFRISAGYNLELVETYRYLDI